MDKNKIPILADNWVIRGTKEIPRLFNKITNKIVKLDNDILDYILDCNGNLSFDDIKNKYNVENEDIDEFYGQFLDENIIELIDIKKFKNILDNLLYLGLEETYKKELNYGKPV